MTALADVRDGATLLPMGRCSGASMPRELTEALITQCANDLNIHVPENQGSNPGPGD